MEKQIALDAFPVFRVQMVRESTASAYDLPEALGPTQAARIVVSLTDIQNAITEDVYAVYLNCKNRVIGLELIGRGDDTSCVVSIPAIARGAILSGANAVIMAHNHPSGDANPSDNDRKIAARLKEALALFNIKLLDAIVIGDRSAYSIVGHDCLVSL